MTFKSTNRLFVTDLLREGVDIRCSKEQSNYLVNVLRLTEGDEINIFNGRDGEWEARLLARSKKHWDLEVLRQVRAQHDGQGPDLAYLFAPLKRARVDYMVQKATELGVKTLRPVITVRTQVDRVNLDRMKANVVEAAEQCGILRVPQVEEVIKLDALLREWEPDRHLVFCDEDADPAGPISTLENLRTKLSAAPISREVNSGAAAQSENKSGEINRLAENVSSVRSFREGLKLALLIGPEGGFGPSERAMLLKQPFVTPLSLGPRIMRADTAAVAALALINAVLGDWCR